MATFEPPLLIEAIPELATWIRERVARNLVDGRAWMRDFAVDGQSVDDLPSLDQEGLHRIIDRLPEIRMVEQCLCGDDFCASFFTIQVPADKTAWLSPVKGGRTFPLSGDQLNIDLLGDQIAHIEVLFRPDIKAEVDAVFRRLSGSGHS